MAYDFYAAPLGESPFARAFNPMAKGAILPLAAARDVVNKGANFLNWGLGGDANYFDTNATNRLMGRKPGDKLMVGKVPGQAAAAPLPPPPKPQAAATSDPHQDPDYIRNRTWFEASGGIAPGREKDVPPPAAAQPAPPLDPNNIIRNPGQGQGYIRDNRGNASVLNGQDVYRAGNWGQDKGYRGALPVNQHGSSFGIMSSAAPGYDERATMQAAVPNASALPQHDRDLALNSATRPWWAGGTDDSRAAGALRLGTLMKQQELDTAGRKVDADRYVADQNLAGHRYASDVTRYGADTERYKSDQEASWRRDLGRQEKELRLDDQKLRREEIQANRQTNLEASRQKDYLEGIAKIKASGIPEDAQQKALIDLWHAYQGNEPYEITPKKDEVKHWYGNEPEVKATYGYRKPALPPLGG